MNLDDVTVELRPRSEWEGAELGVRMVRRDVAAIYSAWFAVTLPLLLVAALMIWFQWLPSFALLLYWWLEPVADGPILRIIARRLFGEAGDWRAAVRAAPSIAWSNKLFLLTPYRFHFARSIAMPVTQLESQHGAARRARARTLNQRLMNHGTGLTIAYQHLAGALYLGALILSFALVPAPFLEGDGLEAVFDFWVNDERYAQLANLLIFYAVQSALEPWFVGAGFGLYVNCRTQLEAWDIEVAFRRMVLRRAAAPIAVVLLLVGVVAPLDRAVAQDEPAADDAGYESDPGFSGFWHDTDIEPALDAVFASEALDDSDEVTLWRAIEAAESREESASNLEWLFAGVGRFVSLVIEFGLWLLLAGLVLLLLATSRRWLPLLRAPARPSTARPGVQLAVGTITPESLPSDLPATVRRLWAEGDKRAALGLLYRGTVYAAVENHGVRLPVSATEGACVDAVTRQTTDGQSDYFRRAVAAWSALAYGAIDPGDRVVDALCDEWPAHYGSAA